VLALGLKIWFEDGWRTGRQTLPLNVVVYNELSAG